VLNHVAMTMRRDDLDRTFDDVVAFYREVFGWAGRRLEHEPGRPLLLHLEDERQFVFVYGDHEGTLAQPMDHFGVAVDSEEALDALVGRARGFRGGDARVEVIDKAVTPAGEVEVVNAYVRFVLPLMVELQYFRGRAR